MKSIISMTVIEERILVIRGQKVMLDADLAELYGVSTKVLNQAVKRNRDRFPMDFMFKITAEEKKQVVTICDRLSKIKYAPVLSHAFTEHGAIMAASVLSSKQAIDASVYVVRAFVRLRQILATNKELAQKLAELEHMVAAHDGTIQTLVAAIRKLMTPPETKEKRIGFIVKESRVRYGSCRK